MSKVETANDKNGTAFRPLGRLDRLYRLYTPWVTARIRRRFGRDAEDVVQEAWLWIIPMSGTTVIRYPKALLLRVASNIAISRVRQARRRAEILEEARPKEMFGYGADQPEAVLLQQITLGLPQPLRDVFVLSRIGGLTNDQIAEQCGSAWKRDPVSGVIGVE